MSITALRLSNRNRSGIITVGPLAPIRVSCQPDQWKDFLNTVRQNRSALSELSRQRRFDAMRYQLERMRMTLPRPVDSQGGTQPHAPTNDPPAANPNVLSNGSAPMASDDVDDTVVQFDSYFDDFY
jgi:hypothetical protein